MNDSLLRARNLFLILAIAAPLWSVGRAPAMTLVEDGRARAVIILPEKPSPAAREGARVLQEHILQISGAELPIAAENEVSSGPAATRGWVLVGEGRLSEDRGFSVKTLGPGGMRLDVRGNVMALLGADERTPTDPMGSLYAVTTFLEEKLGVRYLWPGESGKVVPRRRTIIVDDFHRAMTPLLEQRLIRNGRRGARVREGLDRLGFSADELRLREAEAVRTRAASPDWFRWHKLGGSMRLATGHAFGGLWEKYGKAHPDWFALQPNGSRDQSRNPGRARLCVSNPDLIMAIAEDKIAELDAHPELLGVSIAPNDGGQASFCSCPRCEALDAPNGPEVTLVEFSAWKKRKYRHVALTDRMVYFWNAIAEKVAVARPGKLLVVDAYSAYSTPPVLRKLHPNLVVRFVPMSYLSDESRRKALRSWEQWSGAAGRIFYRPNLLLAGWSGAAYVFPHKFAEDFRFMARRGMRGTDFDSGLHHWSTQGLNYYVVARLNWDPDLDADSVIDDYCRAGFGSAAGAIREYFSRLEALTDEAAAKELEHLEPFQPGAIVELNDMLLKARGQAAGDADVEDRIDFLMAGLRWTEVDARAHALLREPLKSSPASEKKRILDERRALMRDIFQNNFLAVNVASVSGSEDGLWKLFLPTWKQIRSRFP